MRLAIARLALLLMLGSTVSAKHPFDQTDTAVSESMFEDSSRSTLPIRPHYLAEDTILGGSHTCTAACGDSCSAACGPAVGQCERIWVKADYLMWWTKGNRLPPLVTTSLPGTSRERAGVLGFLSTTVLLGDQRVEDGLRNGGRVTAGFWFDGGQQLGLEGSWFALDDNDNVRFREVAPETPILARPFFNVGLNAEDSQLVGYPDVVEGPIDVVTNSEILSGGAVFRRHCYGGQSGKLDFLFGYRYMRFQEDLRISETPVSTADGGIIAQGTTFDVFDSFDTKNDFHGADVGFNLKLWRCPWILDTTAKLAVGGVHQQLDIDGSTTVTVPGLPPVTNSGGLLAQASNIGSYDDTKMAIIPEFGINLHYSVTRDFSLGFGYTVVVHSNVLRTGEQIDLAVDATNLPSATDAAGPGLGRPEARLNDTAVWLQGLNFGIQIRR